MRIFHFVAVFAVLVVACQESGAGPEAAAGPRHVVTDRWDTVFVAGGADVNDTLFAGPNQVALAGDVVVVGDDMAGRLVALDAESGQVEWRFGRVGAGPREFQGIADIAVTHDGTIWVLDFGNGRIAVLTPDGEFLGVRTLHHLPVPPAAILPLDDHAIAMSHRAPEPFMELGLDSLELRRALPHAWPDPIPESVNARVNLAHGPGNAWVSAFALGPGFTVWGSGAPRSYRYRDPIPFARLPSREVRLMGADSARYGARSVEVVEDEILMLFGGRPVRAAHPGEPTVWIDVYSLEGDYLRSYRLPFHANAMATDGRIFYLLTSDGTPKLIALRPIEE